jgi:hypothetical protein
MSSRGRQTRRSSDSSGFVVAHPTEDFITDPSTQGSNRFGLGAAQDTSMFEVRPAWTLTLELGDGDPVEGNVELAVAGPAEAMALGVA